MSETTTPVTEPTVVQPAADTAPKAATSTKKANPAKSDPKAKRTAKTKAAKKAASKGKGSGRPAKPASKADDGGKDTKKAQVREMLRKGTTLAAIMEATGWQPHTTRGFISILSKKEGLVIESTPREDGGRSYKITR